MRRADLNLIAEARERAASGLAADLRRRARLSQAQVAAAAGVSRQAVSAWEAGRSLPKGKHALAYGKLLRDIANWTAGT